MCVILIESRAARRIFFRRALRVMKEAGATESATWHVRARPRAFGVRTDYYDYVTDVWLRRLLFTNRFTHISLYSLDFKAVASTGLRFVLQPASYFSPGVRSRQRRPIRQKRQRTLCEIERSSTRSSVGIFAEPAVFAEI